MTEMELPTELTLTDCALAMDGGSLLLHGVDQSGAQVDLYLEWSINSQREGTTQLYVNEIPIPRGSPQEFRWMELVRHASVRRLPGSRGARGMSISENRIVLADDAAAYLKAIDEGPEAAISQLATRLVSLVSSAAYQRGHGPPPPLPAVDPILALLAEGKKMDAIKAYREAHPDVGIDAARLAVEELAAKTTIAAQQPAAPDAAPSLAPLGRAQRR